MELRRITPEYFADAAGVRDLFKSAGVQKALTEIGKEFAEEANRTGHSTYASSPAEVRVGWKNETRPGIQVREVEQDVRDAYNHTLQRVAATMNKRWRK